MSSPKHRPPFWYWIIIGPAAIWAAMGLTQILFFVGQEMPEPIWAMMGYITAQIVQFLGVVGLFLRRSWARPAFILAATGFLIQRYWLFFNSGLGDTLGPGYPFTQLIAPSVDLLLFGFATWIRKKNWWLTE